MIRWSAELHMDHITRGGDPFEANEARPLDFGHWSAHRLEAMTDFELRHGEAVAIGVAVDTVYSSLVHGLPAVEAHRVLSCLRRLGFHLYHPAMDEIEVVFRGLEEFRQHLGGRLTLTMLTGIGQAMEVHEVDREQMCVALGQVAEFANSQAVSRSAAPRSVSAIVSAGPSGCSGYSRPWDFVHVGGSGNRCLQGILRRCRSAGPRSRRGTSGFVAPARCQTRPPPIG